MADIAAEVPSATTELVKQVLEEYGDPGAENDDQGEEESDSESTASDGQETSPAKDVEQHMSEGEREPLEGDDSTVGPTDSGERPDGGSESGKAGSTNDYPAPDDLSDAQRETLRAIATAPEATQRELAESLDVTAATVSKRVNDLDGFDWSTRQTFAEHVFGDIDTEMTASESDADRTSIEELADKIERLQDRIDDLSETEREKTNSAFDDPDLVHKLVRAAVESDDISEDEERRIVAELMA